MPHKEHNQPHSKEQQSLLHEVSNHHHRTHERAIWICDPFATHKSFLTFDTTGHVPSHIIRSDEERHRAALNARKKTKQAVGTLTNMLQEGITLDTTEKLFPVGSPKTQLNGLNGPARESLAVIRHVCKTLNDHKEEDQLPLFAAAVGLAQIVLNKSDLLHHKFPVEQGHKPNRRKKQRHKRSQEHRIRSLIFAFGIQNLREYDHNDLADQFITEKIQAMHARLHRAATNREKQMESTRRKLN